jgi:hypothetical protein
MRTLQCTVSGNAVVLREAAVADGRVKAPPISIARHQIEFQAVDAAGRVVYRATMDDPRHRIVEYPEPDAPSGLGLAAMESAEGPLFLRLPAELEATAIEFYETRSPAAGDAGLRRLLSRIDIPP